MQVCQVAPLHQCHGSQTGPACSTAWERPHCTWCTAYDKAWQASRREEGREGTGGRVFLDGWWAGQQACQPRRETCLWFGLSPDCTTSISLDLHLLFSKSRSGEPIGVPGVSSHAIVPGRLQLPLYCTEYSAGPQACLSQGQHRIALSLSGVNRIAAKLLINWRAWLAVSPVPPLPPDHHLKHRQFYTFSRLSFTCIELSFFIWSTGSTNLMFQCFTTFIPWYWSYTKLLCKTF